MVTVSWNYQYMARYKWKFGDLKTYKVARLWIMSKMVK